VLESSPPVFDLALKGHGFGGPGAAGQPGFELLDFVG
jgi:hypothetical protein